MLVEVVGAKMFFQAISGTGNNALLWRDSPGVRLMNRAVRFVLDHFLMVPIGAVVALVWANTGPESYFKFAHALSFLVNSVGMALFFALVTQEVIEAMVPGGALHTWRRAALPIVAAIGGTVGAIGVFEAYVHAGDELLLSAGWPIVCAIDGGLSYLLVKALLGGQSAIPFLLVVVIVSDAIGLIVVGLHQPAASLHPAAGAAGIAAGLGVSLALVRLRVRTFWPHLLISGAMLWWGFRWSGLHPALALVPIVPFVLHSPRDVNLFADTGPHDSAVHLEHALRIPVQLVLFLFALVNAGMLLRGFGTGTWAVLTGALIGRPLGILAAVGLSMALGLRLPSQVGWRELFVVAFAASTGFTFGLFFATAVFPIGPVLTELKMGTLLTVAGALVATAVAWLLGAGRFRLRSP
jgi:NhaA family Na+:H+ antiporter